MDAKLVEKIVHEVKSQGVFDEFRKDSMADVDTKPAYQNLRQRVENAVKKFLSEQKWTLDTNKNQLREKLRRHITESGFLDVGVERIVDQVVNPKIGSVFQPRIEEIAYKYLGLPTPPKHFEPPPPPLMHPLPPLPLNAPPLKVETSSLLPTDLEQVSPDSDNATVKSEGKYESATIDIDNEEKLIDDEDESPPFEPLVKLETKDNKDDIKLEKKNELNIKQEYDASLSEKANRFEPTIETEMLTNNSQETKNYGMHSTEIDQSVDARISQDSQLSSVSSDSCLSPNVKEDSLQSCSQEAVAANISEEAQMPKFNENSCEQNVTNGNTAVEMTERCELHFDIKKDEIKFEGTERKTTLDVLETTVVKTEEEIYLPLEEMHPVEKKNECFQFATNKVTADATNDDCDRTPNAQELSFGSSLDDSSSAPPSQTPKNSSNNESPQVEIPKHTAISITPTTTPIPTTPLPTPTSTPSPVASQKPEKTHHSRHSSSSKHKKHSKERRRSNEREKDTSERHRSRKETKDSSIHHTNSANKSSSKHSASSSYSKYSSRNKATEKDIEKSSSSTGHSSSKHTKHSNSHSSSSSTENQEFKKHKRDLERRHHSSSSSSSKRNDSKDDHTEAKHKTLRRKSTDSNGDGGEKSFADGKSAYQCKSNYTSAASKSSKSSSSENYKSSTSKSNGKKDQTDIQEYNKEYAAKFQHVNNVVILNDILENPKTQFIQLNNKGHMVEMPEHHRTCLTEAERQEPTNDEFNNNVKLYSLEKECKIPDTDPDDANLFYFEEIQTNLMDRLRLLNTTMDLCRTAVNSLRFDCLSDEGIELSNEEDVNSDNKKINLLTESLKRTSDFNYGEFETPRKRFISIESDGCQSKTSPTPSDGSSVNSKENEEIHKNTNHNKRLFLDRHKAIQKLTHQQRYSSEDLYKPRPILGQRSRRRGVDSLI